MNIDKLERANILAKSLIPKVDELLRMSKASFIGLTDCFFGTRQPHPRRFSRIAKRKMAHSTNVVNRLLPIVLLK